MVRFNQIQLDEGVRIVNKNYLIVAIAAIFALTNACFAAAPKEKSIQAFAEKAETYQLSALDYSNRASIKFLKKDVFGAINDFDKAIQLSPNNHELYLNRGYIKQVINDLDGALADYNEAIRLNRNFAYAYNNRGVLKVALKDINGAMEDYAKALELNTGYSDVYYNRGNLKYMLSDNQGALKDYNKAIELNPKDSEAYNNRGVVKKRLNFNVGALSDYTQAIALNPKDSIAYANRGRLKKLYFDNEGAAIDLDQAVALAEKQVFIHNVKPLLSRESYIAAVPMVEGITQTPALKTSPSEKAQDRIALNKTDIGKKPASKEITAPKTTPNANKTLSQQNISKETVAASKPIPAKDTGASSTTIVASVATVQAASTPIITTNAVKQSPTTNVKLAESYYIRGLQKCVLRDLQGAIADLNKAIENNTKYADAYFYRAAIRKELGDTEGFRKDYSTAIQINPALQAFNDLNCISLVQG